MSDLHDLCRFPSRPIGKIYLENLKYYLKNGIPATYTIEEAYKFNNNIEEEPTTTTTPLHLLCTNVPDDLNGDEIKIVNEMVDVLFEYGAGWCLTDIDEKTPGCILVSRGMKNLVIYQKIVEAGVRAELLLRKVEELNVEFIEPQEETGEGMKAVDNSINISNESADEGQGSPTTDPACNQEAYLNTKLEYKDNALVTKDGQDGVMMSWESTLMELGCNSLFESVNSQDKDEEVNILNIGFGMGIIDTMINSRDPTKQYICEAHPDVLKKLRSDGWYEKPNVVILEGRWQDQLDFLLSEGTTFFDGIYYDTFSEHYEDMLQLFDYIVGLLKPNGVFTFFNGLGADREVVYDVYRNLVEMDLANYGLKCSFQSIEVAPKALQANTSTDDQSQSIWDDVKRPYWSCPVYYHPVARFIDI
ncbi:uncharacterized protein PRCAT00005994001 [Priceomyces carsonii]|uniref:uncharacterized protein n=1 Tax=Priceomyces carsonii TaxID=28549 RepID=UPI002ED8F31C|nr:unnamed protein product [Priceomyces carsonii]